MPNGDCPVGAANTENIKTLFRGQERTDARMDRIEDVVERIAISTERNKWQIGLIIAGVGIIGNAIAIPLILRHMGG